MDRVSVKAKPSNIGGKKALIGNTAGRVPPAWKSSVQERTRQHGLQFDEKTGEFVRRRNPPQNPTGSKILMSQLPIESVTARDIEELFRETIGPVLDAFIIHNSQGRSKGMAVVHFQRTGDALEARRQYDGKIIDDHRPLKIELIVDPPGVTVAQPKKKTLLERVLGGNQKLPPPPNAPLALRQQTHRRAIKKGPRRLKKSAAQLDQEMEVYMAEAARTH